MLSDVDGVCKTMAKHRNQRLTRMHDIWPRGQSGYYPRLRVFTDDGKTHQSKVVPGLVAKQMLSKAMAKHTGKEPHVTCGARRTEENSTQPD